MTATRTRKVTEEGRCRDCGMWVRWTEGRYGWYLQETTAPYENGARYGRGSHSQAVCDQRSNREAREAYERECAVYAEAERSMAYADAYGIDPLDY